MATGFAEAIAARRPMLAEGSVYERLRRHPGIAFDPLLRHAALIYDPEGRKAVAEIHNGYIAAAKAAGFPLVMQTDTWRASQENIARSRHAGRPVNEDNVAFLRQLRAQSDHAIFIGGVTGCRGDAYRPDEALDADTAYAFHRPQIAALQQAGPDFLIAATLPAWSEAQGIARAMGETGLPYLISFVLRPAGTLLDGTPWAEAMRRLDDSAHPPIGHAANCVHPNVLRDALAVLERDDPELERRFTFFQANAAALSPEELADTDALITEDADSLASQIASLHRRAGITVVGGCCGTDERHIAALGRALLPGAI